MGELWASLPLDHRMMSAPSEQPVGLSEAPESPPVLVRSSNLKRIDEAITICLRTLT